MTIREAIDQVDRLKPNQYTDMEKLRWLNALDGMIWREVFLTHDMDRADSFNGYDSGTDIDTELLIQVPYDVDVYINYLQARIDRENGETAKYNQSITMYNSAYNTWVNWVNRNYRPIIQKNYFRF